MAYLTPRSPARVLHLLNTPPPALHLQMTEPVGAGSRVRSEVLTDVAPDSLKPP